MMGKGWLHGFSHGGDLQPSAMQAADKIHDFILSEEAVSLRRQPQQLLEKLSAPDHPFATNESAKSALEQLRLLFDLLQRMQALDHIAFDLTLARWTTPPTPPPPPPLSPRLSFLPS